MSSEFMSVLAQQELTETAESIVKHQQTNGMILWFENSHADTWNHTEAAMALSATGFTHNAERAYEWLKNSQNQDGTWYHYYLKNSIEDSKVDTNCCAYVATGILHHFLITADRSFLEEMWPVVRSALDFVVGSQTTSGHIPWALHSDGTPWSYSLLTGSSSIFHSLRSGLSIAQTLGIDCPQWELSALRIADLIAHHEDQFEPKYRWAMDWYYPVLSGAIHGEKAVTRLNEGSSKFLLADQGVKCVSDQPWVTAAETCECALAYLATGDEHRARQLFAATEAMRDKDGAYFTGLVYPEHITFPDGERSTYTSAAIILTADALDNKSEASRLLIGDNIPTLR